MTASTVNRASGSTTRWLKHRTRTTQSSLPCYCYLQWPVFHLLPILTIQVFNRKLGPNVSSQSVVLIVLSCTHMTWSYGLMLSLKAIHHDLDYLSLTSILFLSMLLFFFLTWVVCANSLRPLHLDEHTHTHRHTWHVHCLMAPNSLHYSPWCLITYSLVVWLGQNLLFPYL